LNGSGAAVFIGYDNIANILSKEATNYALALSNIASPASSGSI
jgi:hypothetical protein